MFDPDLLYFCQAKEPYWLFTLFIAVFALMFLFKFYTSLLNLFAVKDTPISKIRSAAQGYVHLAGQQQDCPYEITSGFLSKRPCTWFFYQIEEYDRQHRSWRIIETGMSHNLILMHDGTGLCYIDPKGAQITTPCCQIWRGSHRYPAKLPKGFWATLFAISGHYRYTEKRMEPSMPLYASGNFITLTQDQIQSENKSQAHAKLIKAWQVHHPMMLNEFFPTQPSYQSESTSQDNKQSPSISILSRYGLDSRTPFLLSAFGKNQLISSYRWDAFLWGISFIATLAFTLFLLHLGWIC